MGMLVGFKRLKIQPLSLVDGVLKSAGSLIVIEGKANKGGTVKAEISGISKEAKVTSASNIGYYISRKGVDAPKVEFELLDIQQDDETRILGRKETANGVQLTGEDTEAPYCAISMESEDAQGNTAVVAFFYGVFSHDGDSMNTLEVGEDFKPENEKYTYTASANPVAEGEFAGQYMAKYAGPSKEALQEIEKSVLLQNAVA
ncbi:major tail protein [Ligilactobacillus equi]|uniref:Major tail protein n=1 Tax=Ligilactobacillus equi DPC 6820 TaxID=1392007 RepID=V7HVG2_9LACO|nr:major tail protein [Ligilactobacillus equi]ETA73857.1 major tail protein [Ligilactobacillus equi DPC 6820]